MQPDASYLELLRMQFLPWAHRGLELRGISPPRLTEPECLRFRQSYTGLARLALGGEPVLFAFPYPTSRGTFILDGVERSWTLCPYRVSKAAYPYAVPSDYRVLPAELARVRDVLRQLFDPARRGRSQPPEPTPVELEGSLNRVSYAHILPLDQTNPLAAVADQRKLHFPVTRREDPRERHVHDLQAGRICLLETPESEKIGRRLFLARSAALAVSGEDRAFVIDSSGETDGDFLGVSVSMVPFVQHDDGARAMMGGKNLKQAVPLLVAEPPLVKTGWERRAAELSGRGNVTASSSGVVAHVEPGCIVIRDAQGVEHAHPLVAPVPTSTHVPAGHRPRLRAGDAVTCGGEIAAWPGVVNGELALGVNALVGYLPYHGWTFDDGIVVSRSFAQRLTSEHLYEFALPLLPGDELVKPREATHLGPDRLVPEGWAVRPGDLLAVRGSSSGRRLELRYDGPVEGVVVRADRMADRVLVWVCALRPLEVGDKLTGRHGNKGVVSKILEDADMPLLLDSAGTRRSLEVILSPMSVVSRMNLAQLLECHFGWLIDRGLWSDPEVGAAFRQVDRAQLRELLVQAGAPEGKIDLFQPAGDALRPLGGAVVGFQYLCKLNHMARDKLHVRGGGRGETYSALTGQPAVGKRRGGGQRLGEMEVWALLSHGAGEILEEALSLRSDARQGLPVTPLPPVYGRARDHGRGLPGTLGLLRNMLAALGLELRLEGGRGQITGDVDKVRRVRFRPMNTAAVRKLAPTAVERLEDLRAAAPQAGRDPRHVAWARIDLALPVPNPALLSRFFKRASTAQERLDWFRGQTERLAKRRGLQRGLLLGSVPVLPPCFREDAAPGLPHPLTKMYRNPLMENRVLGRALHAAVEKELGGAEAAAAASRARRRRVEREVIASDAISRLRYHLFLAVRRLFVKRYDSRWSERSILDQLDGKYGLLRRHLLGKRVDYSGRAVIVPDPELSLDECRLPLDMVWTWFAGAAASALAEAGETDVAGTLRAAAAACPEARKRLARALEDHLQKQDLLVLLNRQPTLHRHNLLAFRPRVHDRPVIAIPPLVCAGFNADFDGDTMAAHLPITQAAQAEARRLLPSANLLRPANGQLILHIDQDLVLGARALARTGEGRTRLAALLDCSEHDLPADLDAGSLRKLVHARLQGVSEQEVISLLSELQIAALAAASNPAFGFGIFDVEAISLTTPQRLQLRSGAGNQPDAIDGIEKALSGNLAAQPENPVALIIRSGSRGNLQQLRQMAGMIGHAFNEQMEWLDAFFAGSYLDGLPAEEYRLLAHATRRTMLDKKIKVATAGALTRRLVEGCYEIRIAAEDCGCATGLRPPMGMDPDAVAGRTPATPDGDPREAFRSPLTCLANVGVCQRCYGPNPADPAGEPPPPGAMVGILAAQAIGEVGTQLSMKTFHTGAAALPIPEVKALLDPPPSARPADPQALFDTSGIGLMAIYGRGVAPVHIEVVLRAMWGNGPVRGLHRRASDWRARGALAVSAYEEALPALRAAARAGLPDRLDGAKTRLILARWT